MSLLSNYDEHHHRRHYCYLKSDENIFKVRSKKRIPVFLRNTSIHRESVNFYCGFTLCAEGTRSKKNLIVFESSWSIEVSVIIFQDEMAVLSCRAFVEKKQEEKAARPL